MSFFPASFDPRDPAARILYLANVNTPDGDFGFMLGADGRFTDKTGKVWHGSQLISSDDLELSLQGTAPSGNLTLAFIQDPDAPELIDQVRALGADYIDGREITFYVQPLLSVNELYAPTLAPVKFLTRIMRKLTFSLSGAQDRSITLSFESPFETRNGQRRMVYNTTDHSQLVGAANPSLTYIPTDNRRDEKIWG